MHARTEPIGPHKLPYGAYGDRWAAEVLALAKRIGADEVLDYGAGKGLLQEALAGKITVRNFDPVTFPEVPMPADLVVCSDVLPFVETEYLRAVIGEIRALARLAALFIVPCHPPHKLATVGMIENAPLHVWRERLFAVFPHARWHIDGKTTPRLHFTGLVR